MATTFVTHVGLELRLTAAEAEALEPFLSKFRDLIESRVMTCPLETREPLLAALGKLTDRLAEGSPPFEETWSPPPRRPVRLATPAT